VVGKTLFWDSFPVDDVGEQAIMVHDISDGAVQAIDRLKRIPQCEAEALERSGTRSIGPDFSRAWEHHGNLSVGNALDDPKPQLRLGLTQPTLASAERRHRFGAVAVDMAGLGQDHSC